MSNQQLSRPLSTNATRSHLSSDQFRRILSIVENQPRLRDLSDIVSVITYTGIRSGELTKLRWVDVDFPKNRVTVHSKWTHVRYLPFGPKTRQILEARRLRQPTSEFVLGESPTGLLRRISRQLQALGDRAGVGPIPISVFRHSFFKRLFLAGASAESVQFLGGYRTPFLTIESFLTNKGVYEMTVHDQANVEKQQ